MTQRGRIQYLQFDKQHQSVIATYNKRRRGIKYRITPENMSISDEVIQDFANPECVFLLPL